MPIVEILMRVMKERKEVQTEQEGKKEALVKVDSLVIVPIRELAHQVSAVMEPFCRKHGIRLFLFTKGGGDPVGVPAPITPGLMVLGSKGGALEPPPTIVVGTPGRVRYSICGIPHKSAPILMCKKLEVLVLDEADRFVIKDPTVFVSFSI